MNDNVVSFTSINDDGESQQVATVIVATARIVAAWRP